MDDNGLALDTLREVEFVTNDGVVEELANTEEHTKSGSLLTSSDASSMDGLTSYASGGVNVSKKDKELHAG